MDDARLRRAGLDYHEFVNVSEWDTLDAYQEHNPNRRLLAVETSGSLYYSRTRFSLRDTLLFGSETRGLPADVLNRMSPEHVIRLPMLPNTRSINLSNSVAIVLYEAWRQLQDT